MFRAIREAFGRWRDPALSTTRRRRSARIAKLFLFEFVVVVTGVLVAQMLQEYFANARAARDATMTVERARAEAAAFRATSEYWLAAAPCLESRMDELMRAAAVGVDRPDLHGPRRFRR
jgi:hypothetical protein